MPKPWRCDICRKRYESDTEPAINCNLNGMPVWIFQRNFPGHRPKKNRNTIVCHACSREAKNRH